MLMQTNNAGDRVIGSTSYRPIHNTLCGHHDVPGLAYWEEPALANVRTAVSTACVAAVAAAACRRGRSRWRMAILGCIC